MYSSFSVVDNAIFPHVICLSEKFFPVYIIPRITSSRYSFSLSPACFIKEKLLYPSNPTALFIEPAMEISIFSFVVFFTL